MRTRWCVALASLTAALPWGCVQISGNGSGDSEGGTAAPAPKSRAATGDYEPGSCDDWKVSYCDALELCDAFTDRETCEIDVGYLRCDAEAPVASCAERIRAAVEQKKCSELPTECTPARIADRTEPLAACQELHEAVCEWSLFCGQEFSLESCLVTKASADPCDRYIAVWPGIDQCLDEWAMTSCVDSAPEVCRGILRAHAGPG